MRSPRPTPADRAKRRAIVRALAANAGAESQYVAALCRILRQVHEGTLAVVDREHLHLGTETRQDAPGRPPLGLGSAFVDKMIRYVRPEAGKAFDRMAGAAQKHSKKAADVAGLVPITPKALKLEPVIAAARDRNIALVEKAGRAYAQDVRDVIGDPDNFGLRPEALHDLLVERGNVSESRAMLIARDQTLKLNSSLAEHRAKAAGVTRYTWSTSQDERVRPMHAELEGQAFTYDDPPVTNEAGDTNNAGQDYQCRCVGLPILDDDDDEATEAPEEETEAPEPAYLADVEEDLKPVLQTVVDEAALAPLLDDSPVILQTKGADDLGESFGAYWGPQQRAQAPRVALHEGLPEMYEAVQRGELGAVSETLGQELWQVAYRAADAQSFRQRILVHELGHHLHLDGKLPKQLEKRILNAYSRRTQHVRFEQRPWGRADVRAVTPGTFITSQYASVNENEWLAETHSAYVYHPQELAKADPEAYALMRDVRAARGMVP